MPAKKKTTKPAAPGNKAAPVKKVVLRDVVVGDHKGSVDFDLKDDDGMKVLEIRNANKGLIVRFYAKDGAAKEQFCPVGALVDFFMSQPA